MTYATWTVPRLREECKRRGLPAYQCRGRRLLKADLVRQLGKETIIQYGSLPGSKGKAPTPDGKILDPPTEKSTAGLR